MAENNLLFGKKPTEFIGNTTIYITKKSLQFGEEVYQLHNVTGFGASELEKTIIPINFLLFAFIIGFLMANLSQFGSAVTGLGQVFCFGSILGVCYNIFQPKKYGLKIYLNSGKTVFFETKKLDFLNPLIADIYDYINSDKSEPAVYNYVRGNFPGNFIGGDASSNNVNFKK